MRRKLFSASLCLLFCATSCSSISRRNEKTAPAVAPEETDAQKIERLQAQNKDLTNTLAALSTKMEALDTKLNSMNDKIDSTRTRLENLAPVERAKTAPVKTAPTTGAVNLPPPGEDETEGGFVSDEAVRKYRQAMILFESKNYPDAVLAFSAFVEQLPDHPLAGSAQFYLGESYFKQNEYKLAARELGRVITTYDRSPHIADTLRDLAISEEKTGQTEEAARHRQLLTSLFPHSPAAASAANPSADTSDTESAAPAVVITPPTKAEAQGESTKGESTKGEPTKGEPTKNETVEKTAAQKPAPVVTPAPLDGPPPTVPMAPAEETHSQ